MPITPQLLDSSVTDHAVLAQLEQDVGIETLAKLIHLFISELNIMKTRLNDAITQSNIDEIQDVVHVLKNSAALYGAMPLAALARQLHDSEVISVQQHLSAALVIQQNIDKSRNAYQDLVNRITSKGEQHEH